MALDYSQYNYNEMSLHYNQREDFYNKMREIVVVVKGISTNLLHEVIATGVLVDNGLILSCKHVLKSFRGSQGKLMIKRASNHDFVDCSIAYENDFHDLLLLDDKQGVDRYAVIGDPNLHIGMEVHSIAHPVGLNFSLTTGRLGYNGQEHRSMGDILLQLMEHEMFNLEEHDFLRKDEDCVLLQVQNTHGCSETLGSPFFDSRGRVIGLQCLSITVCDFGFMPSTINQFFRAYSQRRLKTQKEGEGTSIGKGKMSQEKGGRSKEKGTGSSRSKEKGKGTSRSKEKLAQYSFLRENADIIGEINMTGGDAETGVEYDVSPGYIWNNDLNCYYDPTTNLYWSPDSEKWFSFNEQTGEWEETRP